MSIRVIFHFYFSLDNEPKGNENKKSNFQAYIEPVEEDPNEDGYSDSNSEIRKFIYNIFRGISWTFRYHKRDKWTNLLSVRRSIVNFPDHKFRIKKKKRIRIKHKNSARGAADVLDYKLNDKMSYSYIQVLFIHNPYSMLHITRTKISMQVQGKKWINPNYLACLTPKKTIKKIVMTHERNLGEKIFLWE